MCSHARTRSGLDLAVRGLVIGRNADGPHLRGSAGEQQTGQIDALRQRIERQDAERKIVRQQFERLGGQVTRLDQE